MVFLNDGGASGTQLGFHLPWGSLSPYLHDMFSSFANDDMIFTEFIILGSYVVRRI